MLSDYPMEILRTAGRNIDAMTKAAIERQWKVNPILKAAIAEAMKSERQQIYDAVRTHEREIGGVSLPSIPGLTSDVAPRSSKHTGKTRDSRHGRWRVI